MKRPCTKCGNSFERIGKRQKVCLYCMTPKARKRMENLRDKLKSGEIKRSCSLATRKAQRKYSKKS